MGAMPVGKVNPYRTHRDPPRRQTKKGLTVIGAGSNLRRFP